MINITTAHYVGRGLIGVWMSDQSTESHLMGSDEQLAEYWHDMVIDLIHKIVKNYIYEETGDIDERLEH